MRRLQKLTKMNVSDIMSKEVYVVQPKQNLAYVRNLFLKKKISRVLVYDGKPLGVLTEKDLARAFERERRGIDEVKISEIMHPEIIAILPNDEPEKAASLMVRKNISGLPVLSGKEILGIVTKTDLAQYFCDNYKDRTTVGEIMKTQVPTVKEFHSVFHAAKLMKKTGADHVVVMRDRKIAGIVSERDLGLATLGSRPTHLSFFHKGGNGLVREHYRTIPMTVSEIMKEKPFTTNSSEEASRTVREMLKKKYGSVIVEKRGKLEGILTKVEVLKYLAEQKATQ